MLAAMQPKLKRLANDILEWIRPEPPGPTPLTIAHARALAERDQLSALLSYRSFDADDNLCYLDEGEALAVGFGLTLAPMPLAGVDAEVQLEQAIKNCPTDTVIQFGVLCSPQVEGFLNIWANARLANNHNALLRQMALRRRDFMLRTATGPSMLPHSRMHPRLSQYYALVRVPFKGDIESDEEHKAFIKSVKDLRATFAGALKGAKIESDVMTEEDFRFMLRELLNPQIDPSTRVETAQSQVPMCQDVIDRKTRVTVMDNGTLGFANGEGEPDIYLSAITVDATPRFFMLPMMAQTLGNPISHEERITCPFWAYTTIHVLNAEAAKDSLTAKLGVLNKQTMSESAWYRAMMRHLYERRDMADALAAETRKSHQLVRAYSGINLYTPKEEVREQVELVKTLWQNAGFRLSEEKYITLPAFLASLPLQYNPTFDPPNKGLQRAKLMHSLNAASFVPIQGDWNGTSVARMMKADGTVDKYGAGPLLVSRRGQLACFDLFQTSINYNFVIVAQSGSGKSFFANEIVCDFLSKGGIARLIDVGRSYYRFCSIMGGQNIVFSPENPMSLNPFSGIKTKEDLDEVLPMLKDLLRQMMYPNVSEADTPPWEFAAIEKGISSAWERKGEQTELRDVYQWFLDYEGDEKNRTKDLAFQLEPYAIGRYARWFSGPRTVSFNNPLVVVELEELKADTQLQAVVMTLIMYQVTHEMYLTDRKVPKLLAIDEAWDLMSGMKTGRFIETSFRRARKYNGSAGVITQSFQDFEKSDAAKAAVDNAAWQFVLYQRPESLDYALTNKLIIGDETTLELLKTVRSGQGFSEIYVRGDGASGLYRFVTDRHSYYTFTSNPRDINRLDALQEQGLSLSEAIDKLAQEDYRKMWGYELPTTAEAA